MRLAWLSDLHLNFVWDADTETFEEDYFRCCEDIRRAAVDALMITGDIAEAPDLERYLKRLAEDMPGIPVYFVLGNHDFYRGSIRRQRDRIRDFCEQNPRFCYLTAQPAPLRLTDRTVLLGHDGWADGRLGDFQGSTVQLADYTYIEELTGLSPALRFQKLNALGDEAAEFLRLQLEAVPAAVEKVIIATHVPPFWDVCYYRGQLSSPEWVPHFGCEAVGDVLIEAANQQPERQFLVYCGHTHFPATYRPKPNLTVFAAKADYGSPCLQRVIECE